MGLFRRQPKAPLEPLPLVLPLPDGSTWPLPGRDSGSFAASTHYEIGSRRAFDADATRLAERLVDTALARLDTGAAPEDAPFLRGVFLAAARTGAGLGLVDRSPAGQLDHDLAGALWQARRSLPAMREDWGLLASWFLLAAHYAARTGPHAVDDLLAVL